MLITRLLTAAVLAGLFIPAILFLPAGMWRALCLVIIAWSAMEWSALSGLGARWMQACYATCIAGGTLAAAVFPIPKDGWYLAAAMFWLLAFASANLASAVFNSFCFSIDSMEMKRRFT